jgi:hypothetical protein
VSAVQDRQRLELAAADRCGVTRLLNGHEWVCVAAVHDTPKQRSSLPDARGYWPRSERHYMVRRYPGTDH